MEVSGLAAELFTKLSLETPEERAALRKGEGWSYEQWNEYVCTLFRVWYARWRYLRRIIAVSSGARDPPVVARPAAKPSTTGDGTPDSDSASEDAGAAGASHVEVELPEPTAEQVAEELEWSILLAAFGKRNPLRGGAAVADLPLRARVLLLHTLVQWHLDDADDDLAAAVAATPAHQLRAQRIHSAGTHTDYILLHQLPGPVRLYSCKLTRDANSAASHSTASLAAQREGHADMEDKGSDAESSGSGSDSADDEFDVGNAVWAKGGHRPAAGGFSLLAAGDAQVLEFCRKLAPKAKGTAHAIEAALSTPDAASSSDEEEEGGGQAAAPNSGDEEHVDLDMRRDTQRLYVSVFEEEQSAHEAAQEAERSRRVSARLAAQVAQAEAERNAEWQARLETRREELSEHFEKHHRTRQRLMLEAQDAAVWGPQRRRMFPGQGPPAPSSLSPSGRRGPSAWAIKAANAAAAEAEAVARREAAEEARREEAALLAAKRGSRSRRRDVMRLMTQLVASANYECGVWRDIWQEQSAAALASAPSHAASVMQQEVGVLEDEREAPLRAAAAAVSRQVALQRHESATQEWPAMKKQWAALRRHFEGVVAWEGAVGRLQRRLRSTRDKYKNAAPTAVLNKWVDSSSMACRAALTAHGTPCPDASAAPPPASGVVGVALLPGFLVTPPEGQDKEEVQDMANKQLFSAVAAAAEQAASAVTEAWLDPQATHEEAAMFKALGVTHEAAEQRADDALATRARRLGKAALSLAQTGIKPSAVLTDRQHLPEVAEHLQQLMRPVRVRVKGGLFYHSGGRGGQHIPSASLALGDTSGPAKVGSYPRLVTAVDSVVDAAAAFLETNLAHIKAHMVPAAPWPVPRMPLVPAGANAAAAVHAARMQAMQLAHIQAMNAQAQAQAGVAANQQAAATARSTGTPGQVHFLPGLAQQAPMSSSPVGPNTQPPAVSGSASVIALPEESTVPELPAPPRRSMSSGGSAAGTTSVGEAEDMQAPSKSPAMAQASHVSVAGAVAGDGSVLSGGRAAVHTRDSFGEAQSGFGGAGLTSAASGPLQAPQSTTGSSHSHVSDGPREAAGESSPAGSGTQALSAGASGHQTEVHTGGAVPLLPTSSASAAKPATVATTAYQASVQSAHVSESSDDERTSKRVPAAHASAGVSVNGSASSDHDGQDSFAGGQSTRSEDGDARRRRHLPAVTGMAPSALGLPSKAPAVDEPQQANALDVAQTPQDMPLPTPNVAPRPAAPFAPGGQHGSNGNGEADDAGPASQLNAPPAMGDGDSVVAQGEPALSVGQPRWAEPRVAAAGGSAMPRDTAGSEAAGSTGKGSRAQRDQPPATDLPVAARSLTVASVGQRRDEAGSTAPSSTGGFEHGAFLPETGTRSARDAGMSSFSFSQAPAAQFSRGGLSAGGASVGTGRPASSSAGSPSDGGSV